MNLTRRSPARKVLSLLLALAVLLTSASMLPGLAASAAGTPTSLGLAEHGLKAYEDKWQYSYGGKGESDANGVRYSDCAGLIYAYFKDLGALGNCMAGVSSQVKYNCVFSGDIDELDGIPRIHGLIVTMPNYNEVEYPYSHVGIYLGNNIAVDNSDYGTNMRYGPVVGSNRDWTAWHVFDNNTLYPSNGWYEFDGALYHYSNCQYDVDTTVDGFTIGSDGIALDSQGNPLTTASPEAPALSTDYVSATTVAQQLASLGYSGKDTTQEVVSGGDDVPEDNQFNGRINANGVRLRADASTSSDIVATLYQNNRVQILESVTGETITAEGQVSDVWYSVVTASGREGYVSSIYVERENTLTSPTFSLSQDGGLVITAGENSEIRYTTDGSLPTSDSIPYTGPIYVQGTYRAVALQDDWTSPMATVTYLESGHLFTDFTDEDWYFSQLSEAVSLGLFQGDETEMRPQATITRAEFAKALANLQGVNLTSYEGYSKFSDVSASSWYASAVNWAYAQGYMEGFGDGSFRPQEVINREQICVTIARYLNLSYEGGAQVFSDDGTISGWAREAVYACREQGIVEGMGENQFRPQDQTIRAQAAVILLRVFKLQ